MFDPKDQERDVEAYDLDDLYDYDYTDDRYDEWEEYYYSDIEMDCGV